MMNKNHEKLVRVVFELEPDEHGWPPVSTERMWAMELGGGQYKIDNIPFYVRGVSSGDIVSASSKDDILYFDKVIQDSEHCTLRIIFKKTTAIKKNELKDFLQKQNVAIETINDDFWAIDVPPSSNLSQILSHLKGGEENKEWEYEEGKVKL